MSDFKVKVTDSRNRSIIYEASPTVGENRTASWTGYGLIHMPADILAFQSTTSRTFQVAGPLISRNSDEARANLGYTNLARQWVLPNFGEGATEQVGAVGTIPPILKLYAYNNDNINGVQVVLRSYSFSFPNDVDYIFEDVENPFPTVMLLSLELQEIYSADQLRQGSWAIQIGDYSRAKDIAGDSETEFLNENAQSLGLAANSATAVRVGPVLGQQTLLGNVLTGAAKGAVSGIFWGQNVLKSIVRGGVVGFAQSPQVREVFNQVQTTGNQFISGVSGRITDAINSASRSVIRDPSSGQATTGQTTPATTNDAFGRNNAPAPTPPVDHT